MYVVQGLSPGATLRSLEHTRRKQEKRGHPTVHPHDIAECEDMLEVYFMQLDFLFGRLTTLNEAVEDTEDLIEVDLDHRCRGRPQNPYPTLGVKLTVTSDCYLTVTSDF